MADLGREGHRERVKNTYKTHGLEAMPDHNVLELLLFYAIPRKDVKPIAYNLINRFKTLDNVFRADIDTLKTVDGIGENAAILISLFKDISTRIYESRNQAMSVLDTTQKSKSYAENLLRFCENEKLIVVCLDNNCRVINHHTVAEGTVNCSVVDRKKIVEHVIRDKAASVILAHNHPHGSPEPSAADISFTLGILSLLRQIHVCLNDHIIVGSSGTATLRSNAQCCKFFD